MLQWISLGAWKLGKWHPHFLANVDCNPQDRNMENWMPFSGLLKMKGVSSLQWRAFPGQNGPLTSTYSHPEDTNVKATSYKVSWQVHASLPFLIPVLIQPQDWNNIDWVQAHGTSHIPRITLFDLNESMRYEDNPHFTDEEIEAQNGYGRCSKLHSWLTCIVSISHLVKFTLTPVPFPLSPSLTRGIVLVPDMMRKGAICPLVYKASLCELKKVSLKRLIWYVGKYS